MILIKATRENMEKTDWAAFGDVFRFSSWEGVLGMSHWERTSFRAGPGHARGPRCFCTLGPDRGVCGLGLSLKTFVFERGAVEFF